MATSPSDARHQTPPKKPVLLNTTQLPSIAEPTQLSPNEQQPNGKAKCDVSQLCVLASPVVSQNCVCGTREPVKVGSRTRLRNSRSLLSLLAHTANPTPPISSRGPQVAQPLSVNTVAPQESSKVCTSFQKQYTNHTWEATPKAPATRPRTGLGERGLHGLPCGPQPPPLPKSNVKWMHSTTQPRHTQQKHFIIFCFECA